MVVQTQVPVSADGARPTTDTTSALLKEEIFIAIHNAFLLGWSILELKSRIQIAACNPEQIDHTISSKGQSQSRSIEALIKGFVLADLQAISEQDMKYYVNRSLNLTTNEPPSSLPLKSLPSELRDQQWLTNVLRALFNRIVTLHLYRFPDSNTSNTIYNIQSIRSSMDYLNGDYATIGITPIKDDGSGLAFKTQFDLYDVTRLAINCLTLLLTTAEATLIQNAITDNQKQLVDAIATATNYTQPDNADGGASTGSLDDQKKQHAIKVLTNLIVQLLDSWDSFLRESYYVDPDAHNTELELTAYESGRSLASISWGASVILAPLESVFKQGTEVQANQAAKLGVITSDNASANAQQALIDKARKTWLNVFNDRDVNYVQYQIMALSTALDEAYYRVNPNIKRTDPNDPTIPPNPNLPGQAIQAVVQSLNYWQRAITRICSLEDDVRPLPNPQQGKPWSGQQASDPAAATTAAGQAQQPEPSQNPTQTVPPGQAKTPSKLLNWTMSIDLRNELAQQSYIWQSLVLCQQGLQSFSIDKVTQKILNEFMSDFEQAIKEDLWRATKKWWIFIAVIGLIILGLLGIPIISAIVNPSNNSFNPSTLLQNPLAYIAALGALIAPFVNGLRSRFAQFGSSGSRFGTAGTDVAQSLTRGYDQVLTEFNYLNHNLGLTYPLVEFFLWEEIYFGGNAVKDGYDFLVHVFWTSEDREEELMRVTQAAFGPIGAYIGSQLNTSTSSSGTQRRAEAAKSKNKQ